MQVRRVRDERRVIAGVFGQGCEFARQQRADFLAVERSGLSLELGKMKKEGLLDYHKEHFVLNI